MADPTKSMAQRFVAFCVLTFIGIVAIWAGLEVLARIWGWVLLIVVIVALSYVAVLLLKRWRSRW